IGRNVNAGVQGLQVDGEIGGDLHAEVGSSEDNSLNNTFMIPQQPGVPAPIRVPGGLTVGPDAVISGDLTYTGREQAAVPAGAVAGEISYTQMVVEGDGEVAAPAVSPVQTAYDW